MTLDDTCSSANLHLETVQRHKDVRSHFHTLPLEAQEDIQDPSFACASLLYHGDFTQSGGRADINFISPQASEYPQRNPVYSYD